MNSNGVRTIQRYALLIGTAVVATAALTACSETPEPALAKRAGLQRLASDSSKASNPPVAYHIALESFVSEEAKAAYDATHKEALGVYDDYIRSGIFGTVRNDSKLGAQQRYNSTMRSAERAYDAAARTPKRHLDFDTREAKAEMDAALEKAGADKIVCRQKDKAKLDAARAEAQATLDAAKAERQATYEATRHKALTRKQAAEAKASEGPESGIWSSAAASDRATCCAGTERASRSAWSATSRR